MPASIDFIIGRAGTGKTYTCYEEIRQKIEKEPLGRPLILLVPEHRTYVAERELLTHLSKKTEMRAVVTGFRRLSWRVLKDRQGKLLPSISSLGKRLLLKKILLKREKDLEVLGRAAMQRRFTEPLEALIEEFRNYNVTPEELREVGEAEVSDKRLSQKLAELALLFEDYREETKGKYQDADDRMHELVEAIPSSPMFEGAEVWIDGFVFFNPEERMVLEALLHKVKAVHITLPLDRDIPFPSSVPASYLFFRASNTQQVIKELASKCGMPVQVRLLEENHRFEASAEGLRIIEKGLFDYGAHTPAEGNGVKLTEAATRRLETEAAVADIVKLCRERDWRWNDFGILLRDAENYQSIVEETLADYDVPFYSDTKRSAVHHPLAELIRSALETVLQGWRYESVFRYVKTGMLSLSTDEEDELENHVLASGICGEKAWGNDWTYRHGRPGETPEQATEILERINHEREIVYASLHELSEAVKAATDVRGLVTAVYELLERLGVRDTLAAWASEAEKAEELDEPVEHRKIWSSVMGLLDELTNITGTEAMKADEFTDILCDGLDTLEIALVPPGSDAVTVASFDQNSLDNIKAVYILGANEGVMPRRSADKGLLTDSERVHIEGAAPGRLELSPNRMQESANENYLLYHGFCESSEYLWVSWALADSEGSGLNRSAVVRRMHSLLTNQVEMIPIEGAYSREEFQFTQPKRAVGQLAAAIRSYLAGESEQTDWTSVYNWAREHAPERLSMLTRGALSRAADEKLPPKLALRLYAAQNRMDGSVSQFETFAQCPFHYFAKYGLHLDERQEYGFQSMDYGNLMHKIMYRFGEVMRKQKRDWASVTKEEQKQLCHQFLEHEALNLQNQILYSTEQYKNLMQRMEQTIQESISRAVGFAEASSFKPAMFEKSFGKDSKEGSLMIYPLSNQITLDLKGKIDRIDVGELKNEETGEIQPYYLVIDYKTGTMELSMLDVYAGLRLQLLTYVMAAERILAARGQDRSAAGLFYCFLKNPVLPVKGKIDFAQAVKEITEKLRFQGWILNTPELIQSIDSNASYLCVKLRGTTISAGKKCAKSELELKAILDYTEEYLQETAESILGGEIRVHPYKHKKESACKYCKYRAVCGFDVKIGSSERILDDLKDEEILLKMMEKTGKGGKTE